MTPTEIRTAINSNSFLLSLINDPQAAKKISEALSLGRNKLVPTEIGSGTILSVLGPLGISGGTFLDTIVAVGEVNRDVYWTMDLIKQGRLRIDLMATRMGLQGIALAVPALQPAVDALLTLGYGPDPISEQQVKEAIYADNGTLLVGE